MTEAGEATPVRGWQAIGFGGLLAALVLVAPAPAANVVPDETFEAWDRDGDGRLVPEEIPERLRGNFDRVDRDGDGRISYQEFQRTLKKWNKGAAASEATVPQAERSRPQSEMAAKGSQSSQASRVRTALIIRLSPRQDDALLLT